MVKDTLKSIGRLILLLAVLAITLHADTKFRYSIDRKVIGRDESATIRLEINGQNLENLEVPVVDGLQIRNSGKQQFSSFVLGGKSETK